MVLLTGFGPFLDVRDNPSARLVRRLHGRRVAGETLIGRVLPVSFERAPEETLAVARGLGARLVLGFGVARGRGGVEVERLGRPGVGDAPDIDGCCPTSLGAPGHPVSATVDVEALAAGLGAVLSEDAGRYVCNAWLYRVTHALEVPVGFVHLPPSGIAPEQVAGALARLLGGLQE